ncbi:MAG: tetratricopeptide repeat protein [Oceanospirillaceae bacterium]|nr:tetratricopeptide repeat protein [Oceanospirillaceae bacterium]
MPRLSFIPRFYCLQLPLRYLGISIACAFIVNCSNPIKSTQPLSVESQSQTPASLTSENLSDLLVGEFSLQRGDSEAATLHLYDVAQSTQDLDTAKRATYLAQFSQNPRLVKQTSLVWSQISPQDPVPWQYIAQSEAVMEQFEPALQALAEELKRGGGDGLPHVASLSINHTSATQLDLQEAFTAWRDIYPKRKQLHLALALLAQHAEQIDAAIIHIGQALTQDSQYLQAQVVYGELLIANQQTQAADAYLNPFTQPLTKAPRHLITLHAQVLTLLAQYQRAYKYFNELTKRYPKDLSYSYSAGLLAYENHDSAMAYRHLQRVLELNPDSHSAYYYLGLSALREDLPSDAMNYLQQVTKGPDRLNAISLLLDIENPDIPQSIQNFQQLRLQNPDLAADLFTLESQYLQDLNDPKSAELAYQAGLKEYPDHIPLLYGYALLAQSLHQFSSTELMLQRIIDIDPNHTNALNALGYAYADRGIKLTEAESLIRKALANEPENAAIIDSLGWVSYRLGHLRQSLTLLTKAYDIMPAAEIAAHLGAVQWALGDTKGAFKTWNLALSIEPDNALIKQAILDAQNEFQSD